MSEASSDTTMSHFPSTPTRLEGLNSILDMFYVTRRERRSYKHRQNSAMETSVSEALTFSYDPMQTSLLVMLRTERQTAVEFSKKISEYIGLKEEDLFSKEAFQTIQYLISKSLEHEILEQELFAQLIKYSRALPDLSMECKAWRLFEIVSSVFGSPRAFLSVVLSHASAVMKSNAHSPLILSRAKSVKRFAQLSLRGKIRSAKEVLTQIETMISKELFTCSIGLPGGRILQVPFDFASNVSEIVGRAAALLNLPNTRSFGLFAMQDEALVPLYHSSYVSDIISLKEKDGEIVQETSLFMNIYSMRSSDVSLEQSEFWNLAYVQAKEEYFRGMYSMEENFISRLCLLLFQAEAGDIDYTDDVTVKNKICDYLPTRDEYTNRSMWLKRAMDHLQHRTKKKAAIEFVELIKNLPFGFSFFVTAKLVRGQAQNIPRDESLRLGINWRGIHVMRVDPIDLICTFDIQNVAKSKSENSSIVLELADGDSTDELTFSVIEGEHHCRAFSWTVDEHKGDSQEDNPSPLLSSISYSDQQEPSEGSKRSAAAPLVHWKPDSVTSYNGVPPRLLKPARHRPHSPTLTERFVAVRGVEGAEDLMSPMRKLRHLLNRGHVLADKYVVESAVQGRPDVFFAVTKNFGDKVFLHFCESQEIFADSINIHCKFGSDRFARLLDVYEPEMIGNHPHCLVVERGSHSLQECIVNNSLSETEKKKAIAMVLSSLSEMHGQSLVHGSLDPQKIIWVKNEATWKLTGLETAVPSGSWSSIKFNPAYASLDLLKSDFRGQKMFKADPSIDMWSLGVIAFELITGVTFWDTQASGIYLGERILSDWYIHRLDFITDPEARYFCQQLLKEERLDCWSAQQAIESSFIKSISSNDLQDQELEMGTFTAQILEVGSADLIHDSGIDLALSLSIEETCDNPGQECEKAPTYYQGCSRADPVFVLRHRNAYSLRIRLLQSNESVNYRVDKIGVFWEGLKSQRDVEVIGPANKEERGYEVIALLDFESSDVEDFLIVQPNALTKEMGLKTMEVIIRVVETNSQECKMVKAKVRCQISSWRDKLNPLFSVKNLGHVIRWKNSLSWIGQEMNGLLLLLNSRR